MPKVLIYPILGDGSAPLHVRVLRQDTAPGEPAALQSEITARRGEECIVDLPTGAAMVITEAAA